MFPAPCVHLFPPTQPGPHSQSPSIIHPPSSTEGDSRDQNTGPPGEDTCLLLLTRCWRCFKILVTALPPYLTASVPSFEALVVHFVVAEIKLRKTYHCPTKQQGRCAEPHSGEARAGNCRSPAAPRDQRAEGRGGVRRGAERREGRSGTGGAQRGGRRAHRRRTPAPRPSPREGSPACDLGAAALGRALRLESRTLGAPCSREPRRCRERPGQGQD